MREIEEQIRNNFNNIWRCADSNKWNILGNSNLLTFDWLDPRINYRAIDLNTLVRGQNSIKPWVNQLRAGDLIFVMGKNYYSGIAIALSNYSFSGPMINMGPDGNKPAINVQYVHKLENPILHHINTHNNPATFSNIENYNFGLGNVIEFIEQQFPNVLSLLTQTMQSMNHISDLKDNFAKFPLNAILYGPPGTGKTYLLQNELIPVFEQKGKSQSLEEFEANRISKLSWWKVIALILLKEGEMTVPKIKDHPYTKYKLAVSDTKSLNQTMWGQLSTHTVAESTTVDYTSRSKTLVFNKKDENSIWYIEETKKSLLFELTELLKEINDYNPVSNDQENYSFITFHQSYSYEDFVEGIKPNLQEETDEGSEISYLKEKGIFYDACDNAAKLAGFLSLKDALENYTKEERIEKFKTAKSFALFIDEINRGNVSAIFGELITLIEEDKRLGSENEIWVDLPYSKDKFGVPPNLYIIGTMNTADRSVEALDTALRRRFTFEEMLPKPELLSPSAMFSRLMWKHKELDWKDSPYLEKETALQELFGIPDGQEWKRRIDTWNDLMKDQDQSVLTHLDELNAVATLNLQELLETINDRIEVLVDRDHTIGHSYFLDVDSMDSLKHAFKNKIIPLLQEYFYGDYRKMEMVIGQYFFDPKKKKAKDDLFAVTKDPYDVETGVYQLRNIDLADFNIKDAIDVLLKKRKLEDVLQIAKEEA